MSRQTVNKESSKENPKERLVLLDAHAILHRAYHALPDFATSRGEPTGALYGLVSMVLKIATDLRPDYLIACYDLPKPTYRHEVYEGYKAGRVKADTELVAQMQSSRKVCEALGIPIYDKEGFEADDMLGTIVEELKGKDIDIIIASGDMDTMQLVNDKKVRVYTLKKGITDTILYDEEGMVERFGFKPALLPDFKGLRGDPSDNIIGIAGIGEKTATILIQKFGTIENIYKDVKNKSSKVKSEISPRIFELLKNGEEEALFSKMLATIRRDAPINFKLPEKKWTENLDLEKAKDLFKTLEFRTMGARLEDTLRKNGREIERMEEKTNKEEINEKELEETKLALWVADSNKTDPNLEDILFFAKKDTLEEAREVIFEELKKRESQFVFEEIEKPLLPIVKEMQSYGVLIDKKFLEDLDKKYSAELANIQKQIWKLAGVEFNVSSPKQLGEILFEKLNLSIKNQKKTAGGAKSTKESELEKMRDLHPIIPLVLEYRELSKLLGTYIEPIPKLLDRNCRLHPTFILAGAATGRMASKNPGVQNIPIGTERGRVIRDAFLAPKGSKLVAFDYSQIELRIAAFLSKDEKLLEIFRKAEDVHTGVASSVFKVSMNEVTKEMRRQAKVINFGILYGMGVTALSANLGSDRKTAQEFLNKYFEEFKGLADYIENQKKLAQELGYTKTVFGRRRYFEGIKSKIPFIKAAAERMAINAPIQGTQADIIKISMRRIDEWIRKNKLEDKIHLILQIHDELIYEIEDSEIEKAVPEIKNIMQSVLTPDQTLGVPIIVNSSVGQNWGEMK